MSLYKRKSVWWIDFTTPAGERIRRSAETGIKAEAQHLHDQLKAEAWRVQKLGERPKYTWDDAGYRWLTEMAHIRTHDDVQRLKWLQQFLRGRVLAEITRDQIAAIGAHKMAQTSGPTANRYLALIRAIMRKACFEWEWIDKAPKVKLYREARRRIRWITPEEVRLLLTELAVHQRDVVLFALATGLRQGNVIGLCWSQVDIARRTAWIHGDQAKGKEDIHVSLSDLAVDVLTRQRGKHPERVFTYCGRPLHQANTEAWRNALKRAGIANFRWPTCATPGPAGWCRTARRRTTCRRWAAGSRWR